MLVEGDLVAIWAKFEGTQLGQMGPFPPSGKKMQVDFGTILRVEDGQIAELWVTWDNMAALAQLGDLGEDKLPGVLRPPLNDGE